MQVFLAFGDFFNLMRFYDGFSWMEEGNLFRPCRVLKGRFFFWGAEACFIEM